MEKKKILSIVIIVVLLIVVGVETFLILSKNKPAKSTDEQLALEEHEIANLKEYNGEIPNFTIYMTGQHTYSISYLDITKRHLKVYEFDAGIRNSWEVKTNHYVGVKVIDILNSLGIKDYSTINFAGTGFLTVTYTKDEIDDTMFVVFYRDGQLINDSQVTLLSTKYMYNYSVESLAKINVN